MGAMQRRKGHDFEREIAKRFRDMNCTARRSLQAHHPYEPDVVVAGYSPKTEDVGKLWLECNHSADPDPRKKLEQAERDIQKAIEHGKSERTYPVVIWKKSGQRQVNVTTRLWVIDRLRVVPPHHWGKTIVTVSWEALVQLLWLDPPPAC